MRRLRVLVIDDDKVAQDLLRTLLEHAGYEVKVAQDGREGLRELLKTSPDLVILDVLMPEMDGWATLERIRDMSEVPVLMLTVRDPELERVRGLRGGADDYVIKPYGHQELIARAYALLRRAGPSGDEQRTYADSLVTIDFAQRAVTYGGRDVRVTPQEFKLLTTFVRHPNQVLSRDQLLELVWGDPLGVSPEQVKLYVGYLRHKLDPLAPQDTAIETVRGFGYRYRRSS